MKAGPLLGLMLLAWLLTPGAAAPMAKPAIKLIGPATLKGMLGTPRVMIIDLRTPSSYASSGKMIKGAVRRDPGQVPIWAKALPRDKTLVLYCS